MLRSYVGSIAFYKHLIITVCLVIIIGLLSAIILFSVKYIKMSGNQALANNIKQEGVIATTTNEPSQTINTLPYQTEYPNLYVDRKPQKAITKEDKVVYLTFDDGPSKLTPRILDILDKYQVKATFFVIGHEDEFNKSMYQEIVKRGHSIAIHTYSHKYKQIYQSVDTYLADFDKLFELIYKTTGVKPEILRFPGGSINTYNQNIYQEIIAEMLRRGFVYYDWNVSAGDAVSHPKKDAIINNVLTNVKNFAEPIILCHDSDNKKCTVDALPTVIERLQKAGYCFDKLDGSVPPVCFVYSY